MTDLTPDVRPVEEVDLGVLSFFDPEADEVFEPKTLVTIKTEMPNGEVRNTNFLIRKVELARVTLELSPEESVELQNSRDHWRNADSDEPVTVNELRANRLMRKFNLASLRLGIVKLELTDAQLENLPARVITELSLAITRDENVQLDNEE